MRGKASIGAVSALLASAAMVGAPVLAQTPEQAQPQQPAQAQPPAQPVADVDWRAVPPDNLLVIDTSRGRILVEMAPEAAPRHVERIRLLARRGFYDGLVWHRVIDWFMAQTGDPLGTGDGQSPYPDLPGEFMFRRGPATAFTPVASPAGSVVGFVGSLPVETQPDSFMALTGDGQVHAWGVYCPGVAGMARGDANDSANSQFFLMRQPYPSLDKRYTVWGRVVSGLDVVRALKTGQGDNGMVGAEPDVMVSVRVASDIPEISRPSARVLDTRSTAFQAQAEAVRAARGADFSICDLEPPVQVTAPAT